LRAEAPKPSDEFVDELARVVSEQTGRRPRRRSSLAFAGAVIAIVLAATAATGGIGYAASGAQAAKDKITQKSSAQDQYANTKPVKPPTAKVASTTATKSPPAAVAPASGGTLPFTGLSIAGTVVIGLSLVGAGIALRRRERRE
jgi:hypothetical protein